MTITKRALMTAAVGGFLAFTFFKATSQPYHRIVYTVITNSATVWLNENMAARGMISNPFRMRTNFTLLIGETNRISGTMRIEFGFRGDGVVVWREVR